MTTKDRPWHDAASKLWKAGKTAWEVLDHLTETTGYAPSEQTFRLHRKLYPDDFPIHPKGKK